MDQKKTPFLYDDEQILVFDKDVSTSLAHIHTMDYLVLNDFELKEQLGENAHILAFETDKYMLLYACH